MNNTQHKLTDCTSQLMLWTPTWLTDGCWVNDLKLNLLFWIFLYLLHRQTWPNAVKRGHCATMYHHHHQQHHQDFLSDCLNLLCLPRIMVPSKVFLEKLVQNFLHSRWFSTENDNNDSLFHAIPQEHTGQRA